MRIVLLATVALICAPTTFAQSVIFLDEGINTQQSWRVPAALRGSQGCRSIPTGFRGTPAANAVFLYGSLCTNPVDTVAQGVNVSEYPNKKRYTFSNSTGTKNIDVTLKKTINNLNRGEHGNWVSNAAYDFDKTIVHRPWVVFGIDRETNNSDRLLMLLLYD